MQTSHTDDPEGGPRPGRSRVLLAGVLALVALCISAYLTAQSLTGQAVAGCGSDEGCGAVLASPWSKVAGLPISLLGSAAYLAVLFGLGLRMRQPNKLGDFLLLATAPAMLIAAGWFTYIQLVQLQDICPYCMVGHGIGVVLGLLLPAIVLGTTPLKPAAPIALGALACLGVIALQHATLTGNTQSSVNPFADRDGDQVIDGKRHLSLFGGELHVVLQDTPYIGNPRAEQVVAVIFDYACPHCRATHELLEEAMQEDPDAFVVVPLPISIDEKHNNYIRSSNARFDDSYELATLSLAVAAVDLEKWRAFDRWLFDGQSTPALTRSADEARAQAAELIGEAALDAQLSEEQLASHRAAIDRNTKLLSLLPTDKRYIPVITSPGAPSHLTGRFYDIAELQKLLQQAEKELRELEPADSR